MIYGTKIFKLFPPTDTAFLPEHEYKTYIYKRRVRTFQASQAQTMSSSEFNDRKHEHEHEHEHDPHIHPHIKRDELCLSTDDCPSDDLSWIPLDPHMDKQELMRKYPQYHLASPIVCEVGR